MRHVRITCFALLVAGCSGSADLGGGPEPGGPSKPAAGVDPAAPGAGGGTLGEPPAVAPNPIAAGALSGIWDITGSQPGMPPVTGILEMTSTRMAISFGATSLAFDIGASGATGQWTSPRGNTAIVTTRTAGAGAVGAIPFPLPGTWSFASPVPGEKTSCTGTLAAPSFAATCTSISGHPSTVPNPKGSPTGTRVDTRTSSFGDLGGRWDFFDDAATGCSAVFENETMSWSCHKPQWSGKATVTFTATTAVGSTSAGTQFSALKR
jgi:hypothetical protein